MFFFLPFFVSFFFFSSWIGVGDIEFRFSFAGRGGLWLIPLFFFSVCGVWCVRFLVYFFMNVVIEPQPVFVLFCFVFFPSPLLPLKLRFVVTRRAYMEGGCYSGSGV